LEGAYAVFVFLAEPTGMPKRVIDPFLETTDLDKPGFYRVPKAYANKQNNQYVVGQIFIKLNNEGV
jgi:hypothetical protein